MNGVKRRCSSDRKTRFATVPRWQEGTWQTAILSFSARTTPPPSRRWCGTPRQAPASRAKGREGVFGLGKLGVWGQGVAAAGDGVGVLGEAEDGIGVEALGQGYGIGVWAMGGRAPLLLKPSSSRGAPAAGRHERGELMVDNRGDLYLCKRTGTPGTWARIG